jgi:flagellar protein FliT
MLTLLDYYQAIENTSSQMLQAAEADDWDEVVRL